MTSKELQERLTKAQEKLTKKEALVKKYEAKAEKVKAQIIARGWDLEAGKYQKHTNGSMQSDEAHDCYWTFCDLEDAQDSIKSTLKAIEEQRRIVEKWADAVETEKKKEKTVAFEYPEIFTQYKNNLVDHWTKYDMSTAEFYRKEYERLGYRDFFQKYKGSAYDMMHAKEEDFRRQNEKAADRLLLNLWNRVKEKVGTPTEYHLNLEHGNEWEGLAINGFVKGTDGSAVVESILAGGYNIQKLHIRTIVR